MILPMKYIILIHILQAGEDIMLLQERAFNIVTYDASSTHIISF